MQSYKKLRVTYIIIEHHILEQHIPEVPMTFSPERRAAL